MVNNLKILLISPFKNESLRVGQYLSPPFGLYRIASYLNNALGIEAKIFDPDLKGINELYYLIKNEKFDIIGFSLLQPTLKNDVPLICSVKEISPNSLLIAGGQGAVFNINLLMNNSPLDIIVKGFGEFPLEEITKNFSKKGTLMEKFGQIKGISIKTGKEIHHTLPIPAYTQEQFEKISIDFDFSKVPYEEYWKFMEKVYSEEHLKIMKNENMIYTIRLVSSSHCPMGCSFCSSTNFLDNATCSKQRVVSLKAEHMFNLIKNARTVHPKVKAFYFCDDDFLQDKGRINEFCDLLERDPEFKNITFFCLSRPDRTEPEILNKMYKNGFKFLIYGVDSFSNKVLTDMNKKIYLDDKKSLIINSINKTLEVGITPLMNIILFYPTVSREDIIETIENSIDLMKKGARLTVYTYVEVYPGSGILNSDNLDFVYETIKFSNKNIKIPKVILPNLQDVKVLAEDSIKLRDLLISSILKEYEWKSVVPHPLYGLALFLAVYKKLNLDTSKINSLIKEIMNGKSEMILEKPLSLKK